MPWLLSSPLHILGVIFLVAVIVGIALHCGGFDGWRR